MNTANDLPGLGKAVRSMTEGSLDILWIHRYATKETCNAITANFLNQGSASPRKDNVPGLMIGDSHYFKSPEEYIRASRATRKDVTELFKEADDPIRSIYKTITIEGSFKTRAAVFNGTEALHTRAISWKSKPDSSYLLQPHDDVSQVFCTRNEGWEITSISTLIALNFYPKAQEGQGALRVFDLKHTTSLAEKAEVTGSGYPYPSEMLKDIKYVDIPVSSGDVVMINGSFIHGVLPSLTERIVLNSFLGDLDQRNMIYWT